MSINVLGYISPLIENPSEELLKSLKSSNLKYEEKKDNKIFIYVSKEAVNIEEFNQIIKDHLQHVAGLDFRYHRVK